VADYVADGGGGDDDVNDDYFRLHAREKEAADADRRCRAAETRFGELQLKLNDSDSQRAQAEAQYEVRYRGICLIHCN